MEKMCDLEEKFAILKRFLQKSGSENPCSKFEIGL